MPRSASPAASSSARSAAHDVQMPGRLGAVRGRRQRDELAEAGLLVVARGGAAPVGPAVERRQLDAQDRRLQLVEARVVADVLVGHLVVRAVEAQHPRRLRDGVVVRRDRAAVAEAAEVLGGKEAERRGAGRARPGRPAALRVPAACAASSSTGTPSASISATGARLPNRCTATTAFVAGVSAAATVCAVTQYVSGSTSQNTGRAPVGRDRLGRRVEREGRHDHVVARPDAHRAQGDRQRVGAVGDADGVARAAVGRRTPPRRRPPPVRG